MSAKNNKNGGDPFKQAIPLSDLPELESALSALESVSKVPGVIGGTLKKQQALLATEIKKRKALTSIPFVSSPLAVDLISQVIANSLSLKTDFYWKGFTFSVSAKGRYYACLRLIDDDSVHNGSDLEETLMKTIHHALKSLTGSQAKPSAKHILLAKEIEKMIGLGALTSNRSNFSYTQCPPGYNFGQEEVIAAFGEKNIKLVNKPNAPLNHKDILGAGILSWRGLAGIGP
jgi:hypothetical protein